MQVQVQLSALWVSVGTVRASSGLRQGFVCDSGNSGNSGNSSGIQALGQGQCCQPDGADKYPYRDKK